ncbi:hypothetical protein B0H16DRAFT_1904785 [Mycena metata]|uniref:F-box domain-containing protein n=1 Tax=Mycena metata TaxID=1033252 RepID=A0AAD7GFW5_9AGAR|nr:hypothetical protein B0H16DRAFT_1904785 [Mycena metata]
MSTSVRAVLIEQTVRTKRSTYADIRGLIEESELKLASLDSEIANFKLPMTRHEPELPFLESETPIPSHLIKQRDHERATAAALRHLIAPVRSLPIELLAEIFSLTIRDKEVILARRYKHFQDAYRVSHVCSEWQQITLCTPQLWTGTVLVTSLKSRNPTADVDGLRAWLARSNPLSIPVCLSGLRNLQVLPPIVEEMLHVAHRWKSLHLEDSASPIFYQRLVEYSLDSLQEADLAPERYGPDSSVPRLGSTPLLREVVVKPDPLLGLPWEQLTTLTLMYGLPNPTRGIIAQCANLITLNVDTGPLDEIDPRPTIIFPGLHELSLIFRSEDQAPVGPFLAYLDTPALGSLSLALYSDYLPIPWPETSLTAFQLRAQNITHLRVDHSTLTSNELIAALVHAPFLTRLDIYCCTGLDDAFILALHYKVGATPLVPLLNYISLVELSEALSEDLLAEMFSSRWWTDEELVAPSTPSPVTRWSHIVLAPPYEFSFTGYFSEDIKRRGLPAEFH